MKRILIAALVAAGTLISAISCATTDSSSQGSTSQDKSTRSNPNPYHYPNY
jgi:hypothetical protein